MSLLPHVVPTAFDLLAIILCIGLLATELWVIPYKKGDSLLSSSGKSETVPFFILHDRLWRCLGLALAGLTVMSVVALFSAPWK